MWAASSESDRMINVGRLNFNYDERDQKTPAFYDYIGHSDYMICMMDANGTT